MKSAIELRRCLRLDPALIRRGGEAWIITAALIGITVGPPLRAAAAVLIPVPDDLSAVFDKSKTMEMHREAQRLAATGDVAAMEKLLCPEPRTQGSAVLIDQATRLTRVAKQLVGSEKRIEAVPVAEAALQRIEQVENRSDPESTTWKLQAKLTKALIFQKVLFDNERAYLALRECAHLDPSRKDYERRAENLAPYLDNLRYYGTKTPALNRAYRNVERGAIMHFSATAEGIMLEVTGLTGSIHRLETSTDLIHWSVVTDGLRTGDVHHLRDCRTPRLG